MAGQKNYTSREGSDRAAISAIHPSCSRGRASRAIHSNSLSGSILTIFRVTFLEGAPGFFGQIVAADI